jgi:hypothetical protein
MLQVGATGIKVDKIYRAGSLNADIQRGNFTVVTIGGLLAKWQQQE